MSDLAAQLKKKMGYTQEDVRCEKCYYYKLEENPYLDRDWVSICTYNKIENLVVEPFGRCNFFDRKGGHV